MTTLTKKQVCVALVYFCGPEIYFAKVGSTFLNLISALKVKVNKELRLGKGWGGYWHEKGVVLYLGKVR